MRDDLITNKFLRELFTFNEEGELFWNVNRPQDHFKTKRDYNAWKTQFAGIRAGGLNPTDGYRYTRVGGRLVAEHRVLFALYHDLDLGEVPDEIDHINTNKIDNKKKNLRGATSSQNKHNSNLSKANKSGFKGVSWHTSKQKWRATICLNYKHIHLGYFSTPQEAFNARNEALEKYHKEFANTGVCNA